MIISASRNRNGGETFKNFYDGWVREQNGNLNDLISAANSDSDEPTAALIGRVVEHYEKYYLEKERWESSLENAFLWVGGWRPTMAFHLLYLKSGIQLLQSSFGRISDLVARATSSRGNLAGISSGQLAAVDALQRRTVREEKDVSERMAREQETVAAADLVELVEDPEEEEEERFWEAMRRKEERLGEVLVRADKLRLETLKGVVELLSPAQALHFLIAAAELHLRLHD